MSIMPPDLPTLGRKTTVALNDLGHVTEHNEINDLLNKLVTNVRYLLLNGGGGGGGGTGKQVEFRKTATYVQWRYQGDATWTDLISLSEITGPAGANGLNIELQKTATQIQWRVAGGAWNNLVALSEITGPAGTGGGGGTPNPGSVTLAMLETSLQNIINTVSSDTEVDQKVAAALANVGEMALTSTDVQTDAVDNTKKYIDLGFVDDPGHGFRIYGSVVTVAGGGGGGGGNPDFARFVDLAFNNAQLPAVGTELATGVHPNFWAAAAGMGAPGAFDLNVQGNAHTIVNGSDRGCTPGTKFLSGFARNLDAAEDLLPGPADPSAGNGRPVAMVAVARLRAGFGNPEQAELFICMGTVNIGVHMGHGGAPGTATGPYLFGSGITGEFRLPSSGYGTAQWANGGLEGPQVWELVMNGTASKLRCNGIDVTTLDLSGLTPGAHVSTLGAGDQPWRGECEYGIMQYSLGVDGADLITDAHITSWRNSVMGQIGATA